MGDTRAGPRRGRRARRVGPDEFGGRTRRLLLRPERNGYVYVLDRTTGEVLSATPFAHVTASRGVDLRAGRVLYVDEKRPAPGKVVRDICPASPGARDWQPSAWSPRTRLLDIPHDNLCMDWEDYGEMRRAEAVQLTGGDPARGRAARAARHATPPRATGACCGT